MSSDRKKRRRHRRKKRSQEITFFQDYGFEITVVFLLGSGIFLLLERMKIKTYLFNVLLVSINFIKNMVMSILSFGANIVRSIETSDIVGVILILVALGMVAHRTRGRIIRRYSELNACPQCGEGVHRTHRTLFYRLLAKVLSAKVMLFTCKKCDFRGVKIKYHT
tara:strand:- start:100 stop:594 length:495 start_codon:yes stop_codon:yes gene_type:complete